MLLDKCPVELYDVDKINWDWVFGENRPFKCLRRKGRNKARDMKNSKLRVASSFKVH